MPRAVTKRESGVKVQFKLAEIADNQMQAMVRMALVQNCLAGIRGQSIFGLMPPDDLPVDSAPPHPAAPGCLTLFLNVFTTFEGLDPDAQKAYRADLKSHIQTQWNRLLQSLHENQRLKMTPQKSRISHCGQVVFDTYRWQQLLRGVSPLLQVSSVDALVQSGCFRENGMNMQLTYIESRGPMFEIRVDLGRVPAELNEHSVWKGLLIHNQLLGEESGIWWGLHPDGDRVVMVVEHDLSTSAKHFSPPDPQELAHLIKDTARQAGKLWDQLLFGVSQAQALTAAATHP